MLTKYVKTFEGNKLTDTVLFTIFLFCGDHITHWQLLYHCYSGSMRFLSGKINENIHCFDSATNRFV